MSNTMREILFRGKRADNGKWVEGFYVIIGDENHCIFTGQIDLTQGSIGFEYFKVDSKTVGAYAGLTDKNGTKIFEGDIVEFNLTAESAGCIVWMDEEAKFAVQYEENDLVDFDSIWGRELEVIGSIHDNSELLKQA